MRKCPVDHYRWEEYRRLDARRSKFHMSRLCCGSCIETEVGVLAKIAQFGLCDHWARAQQGYIGVTSSLNKYCANRPMVPKKPSLSKAFV